MSNDSGGAPWLDGDFCLLFGHDDANAKKCAACWGSTVTTARLKREHELAILPRHTDADAMLGIGAAFTKAVEHGAELIRMLGNIGWGRDTWPAERVETHPLTICGNIMRANPHYLEFDEFLTHLGPRKP